MGGKGSGEYKKGKYKKVGVVSIRLTPDLENFIFDQAKKAGVTKSFVINQILKKWYEREK